MNYYNLYADFNSLFPECTDELKALANAADAEETDGMHIMFSFVVIPFILDLLIHLARHFTGFGIFPLGVFEHVRLYEV